MTTSSEPGAGPSPFDPSPFDPSPWPPWDLVAAAGTGEFYGSLVRQLQDELSVDGFDAAAWAAEKITAAQDRGTITGKDAARLREMMHPTTDGPAAARLFQEAMDDPDSSPAAVTLLSIAKYKEEHATTDHVAGKSARAIAGFGTGMYLLALGPVGLGIFVAAEVAAHVNVRVTLS